MLSYARPALYVGHVCKTMQGVKEQHKKSDAPGKAPEHVKVLSTHSYNHFPNRFDT